MLTESLGTCMPSETIHVLYSVMLMTGILYKVRLELPTLCTVLYCTCVKVFSAEDERVYPRTAWL